MRLPIYVAVLVLCAGLLGIPAAASVEHAGDPRTKNLHPLGESFEAGSLTPFIANSDLAF